MLSTFLMQEVLGVTGVAGGGVLVHYVFAGDFSVIQMRHGGVSMWCLPPPIAQEHV